MSDDVLALIGFLLILVLIALFVDLYMRNNLTSSGTKLGIWDTIKKVFAGIESDIEKEEKKLKAKLLADFNLAKDKIETELPSKVKKQEVFNISENKYTYDQAKLVCEAYGAKLATYDQVMDAWRDGANWCNYGWSDGQMALYPTQQDYWSKLQQGPSEDADMCGRPGVNGGYFSDKHTKLGVNCYGVRPEPNPAKIVYTSPDDPPIPITEADLKHQIKIEELKEKIAQNKINVLPWSGTKWSEYATKNSTMIIDGTPVICPTN